MSDHTSNPKHILNKVSRRNLLRDSAIAATGTLLLPSFITGCTKDNDAPAGGGGVLGGTQLTPEQLQAAADNLRRMRAWVIDLYPLCVEYEDAVFHTLASTKEENPTWTNFIANIFIDVATVLSAAAAISSGVPAAVPAFAFLSAILHDWGIGKTPPPNFNLDDEFASFEFGHVKMQEAIEQKLSSLADPGPNKDFSNLTAAWTDPIVFPADGKTYTIGDLASKYFPDLGDDYNALQSAAIKSFQQSLWNLVIIRCCKCNLASSLLAYEDLYNDGGDGGDHYSHLLPYAQQVFYTQKENKGRYLRAHPGAYYSSYRTVILRYWEFALSVNGAPFTEEACNQLFMDDTPEHIINPSGLFNRAYVYQQFQIPNPTYFKDEGFLELGSHFPDEDFGPPVDWDYSAGAFPDLI